MSDPESIGRYTVLRRLGVGGMGAVYLARSPGGLNVAIKVIRQEFTTEPHFRTRFRREIDAVRVVSPLYTAPIVDSDPDAETPWFATVFLDGESVTARVQRTGPLPADAVRSLAAGCAEALAAIHAAGLVHRDVTPSNVLLLPDGPRIIDFGIARLDKASALTVGYVGTMQFASPEHFDAPLMGPHSDVYSLGATLCYAATGHGPAGEGSTSEVLARVLQGRLDLTGLDPAVAGIVEACLRLDPTQRPTATALLDLATAGEGRAPAPTVIAAMPAVAAPKPDLPATAAAPAKRRPAGITEMDQARTSTTPARTPATTSNRKRFARRLTVFLAAVVAIGVAATIVWWPPHGKLSIQSIGPCASVGSNRYTDIEIAWSGDEPPASPPDVTLIGAISSAARVVASPWTGSTAPFVSRVGFVPPLGLSNDPISGSIRVSLSRTFYVFAVEVPISVSVAHPCGEPGQRVMTRTWRPF